MKRERKTHKSQEKGQMTVEYTVMFVAIVAVIIYASTAFIQPSVNKFFNGTSKIINKSVDDMENRFG